MSTSAKRVLPFAVLIMATVLAVLPLLLRGASCGHDLTFHLLNWMDAARQWSMGTLRPWWCFAGAWNTGEPRFLFYPPLSWMVGALLGLMAGFARAPIAFTIVALFACGISMRHFLRTFVGEPVALLGACLYLAHPYMLFTAIERTAFAELLAAAWLPWLLHEATRERVRASSLAIPVGLLWLTNMPAAVLSTYALAVVFIVRSLWTTHGESGATTRTNAISTLLGFAWGVAVSAFYLLPALVQHEYVEVNQALTGGMQPQQGMLFVRTGEVLHDNVVRQASWLAIVLLSVAAVAVAVWVTGRTRVHRMHGMRDAGVQHQRAASQTRVVPILVAFSLLTLFLLTPASTLVWRYAPELRFLQFPFRTLALQGGTTVALVAFAIPGRVRMRVVVPIALLIVAALAFTAHSAFAQACDDEDAPTSLVAQYMQGDGFEPYDEYTPAGADNDLLHRGMPPAWTAADANAAPSQEAASRVITMDTGHATRMNMQVRAASADRFLIVRQRRFANWHVFVDGLETEAEPLRDDALLAIPIAAGSHDIRVEYRWSADQISGALVSTLAMLALVAFARFGNRRPALLN